MYRRFVLTGETTRPQVFSVSGSIIWQFCCMIDVIFYTSQNSSKFGRQQYVYPIIHGILANQERQNILNE